MNGNGESRNYGGKRKRVDRSGTKNPGGLRKAIRHKTRRLAEMLEKIEMHTLDGCRNIEKPLQRKRAEETDRWAQKKTPSWDKEKRGGARQKRGRKGQVQAENHVEHRGSRFPREEECITSTADGPNPESGKSGNEAESRGLRDHRERE